MVKRKKDLTRRVFSVFISSVRYKKILSLNYQAAVSGSGVMFPGAGSSMSIYFIDSMVFLCLILIIVAKRGTRYEQH